MNTTETNMANPALYKTLSSIRYRGIPLSRFHPYRGNFDSLLRHSLEEETHASLVAVD